MHGFACPNPVCTHVFPRDAVTGTGSVTCPRCGKVFQFRARNTDPAPAKPAAAAGGTMPAAPEQARPAGAATQPPGVAIPLAHPVEPAPSKPVAPAAPASPFAVSLAPDPASDGSRRYRRRWRGWEKFVALGLLLAGVAAGGYVAWPWLRQQFHRDEAARPKGQEHVSREFNYRFVIPPGWESDSSLKAPLRANCLTLRRTNPNAWLALAAQDYKTNNPRDATVRYQAVERLDGYFKNLEYDAKPDTQLDGRPAQRLVFQGEVNEVRMSGECFVVVNKGIAYWLMLWAPAEQVARVTDELADLRQRFSLRYERDGWTEKRPPVLVFRGKQAPYELRDAEGLWEAWPQPQDADPDADLFLQAHDPAAPEDVAKMARVLVLVLKLPAGRVGHSIQVAVQDHVKKQEERERTGARVELLDEGAGAEWKPTQIGEASGQLVRLRIKGDNRNRLVLLAVVQKEDHLVVIECDCGMKRRSLWERDFEQLLATFRWAGK
jgi:hypothetical protein